MAVQFSAVVITLNAADQLAACLASLTFADECIVVDSGSVDATRAIALQAGARFMSHRWGGFGPQKQFAVEQATYDWVLCVDADERVSEALQRSIVEVLKHPTKNAYMFNRRNQFMGRWLRFGEGYPDKSVRLFNRRNAGWSADTVHERVVVNGSVGGLSGDILHISAKKLEDYIDKQNRYTTLQAEQSYAQGKRSCALPLWISPIWRFIKFYIWRLGVLDGIPGLVHVVIGCVNSLHKYAKLRELSHSVARLQERKKKI